MGIAVVVIANDFSAINVALPTMEKDFNTNINTIQWVVNAYALTFGVMIVTGGRLADMKRIAAQEALKLRLPITSRGTSACLPARRSIGTKATSRTVAKANMPSTRGSPKPQSSI